MSAAELLNEIYSQGVYLAVESGSILCRSAKPLSDELIIRIKAHKAEIIDLLNFQKQRHGKPYLKNGELRVSGLLPPGSMLDTLLELNAPAEVIGRYIHPIGTPASWKRWGEIRNAENNRTQNQVARG